MAIAAAGGPDDILPTLEQALSGQTNGAGAVALVSEPGMKMAYSGGGYTVMQLLVEEPQASSSPTICATACCVRSG
jgi:hypothetical protein